MASSASVEKFPIEDAMVWVDCEMTGLGVNQGHRLLEVAVIVTDKSLSRVIKGPELIIHQNEESLDGMNDWCKNMFGWRSRNDFDDDNLAAASLKSKISEEQAEEIIMEFLRPLVPEKKAVLAGNSVHVDRQYLEKFMPNFIDYLHYRIVDVSTVKELARRWSPKIAEQLPWKKGKHRALEDIEESIDELRFYQQNFFKLD